MASEEWDVLFDAILAESAVLGARVSARMRTELPAFGPIAKLDVPSGVLAELARVMPSARRGHVAVSDADLSELAAVGRASTCRSIRCCVLGGSRSRSLSCWAPRFRSPWRPRTPFAT